MEVLEIVKARFHEAADTEKYLSRPRVGNGAGFWPLHQYTEEDREGWDDAARADNADKWARNRKLTREAIARHDECLTWTILFLPTEDHRHTVWKWAFCQANGWSFSESCRRKGWPKVTAYRRLNASFERITKKLLGFNVFPREPDEKFLVQDAGPNASNCVIQEIRESGPTAIPFSPGYRTERSRDLLTNPTAIADFIKHRDRTNAERRRLQEREARRREKIGAIAS